MNRVPGSDRRTIGGAAGGALLSLAACVGLLGAGVAAGGLSREGAPPVLVVASGVVGIAGLGAVWSDRLRGPRLLEMTAHVLAGFAPGVVLSEACGWTGIASSVATGAGLVATWFVLDRRWWARGGPAAGIARSPDGAN